MQESYNLCDHSVVKWHEVTVTFVIVECVSEMTTKKSCKYCEYELLIINFKCKYVHSMYNSIQRSCFKGVCYVMKNIKTNVP